MPDYQTYPIKLDKGEIEKTLPHRGLALMLDEGEILGSLTSRGSFTFTQESYPMFQGHFPDYPVVRAVDLIEALALTTSLVIRVIPECQGLTGMFRGVKDAEFKREVRPGDKLEMTATITSHKGRPNKMIIGEFEAEGKVKGEVAVTLKGKFFAIPLTAVK